MFEDRADLESRNENPLSSNSTALNIAQIYEILINWMYETEVY